MPDLFGTGTLDMQVEQTGQAAAVLGWADVTVNRIAVLVLLVLLVLSLKDILLVFPRLLHCVPRWKGVTDLEHSVGTARVRNSVALFAAFVFCVVADRLALLNPSFKAALGPQWGIAVNAGLLLGMLILRRLIILLTPMRSRTSEFAASVRNCFFDYFILLVALMLISALLCAAFKLPDAFGRTLILVEIIVFYALHLIRCTQILGSRYNIFTTFLYLCALEILPVGILVFTCTR